MLVKSVLRRFRRHPWRTRIYVALRRVVLPLDAVEAHVPASGRVLDACCGHGLLTILMAMRSKNRDVVGIDLDRERIAAARMAGDGIPRLTFEVGDLFSYEATNLDAVTIIDALHYFDPPTQRELLRRFRGMLVTNGTFICRTPVRETGPRFWWSWLHERVTVGLAITATRDRSVHVLPLDEFLGHVRGAGFTIERVERTRWWLPYTDRLIVSRAA